jgi:hypothetical protein
VGAATSILPGAGGLKLDYEEQRSALFKQVTTDETGRREETTSAFTVELGSEHVAVTRGAVTRIYDFRQRRVFTLNAPAKVYMSSPLYAEVAHRANESSNRLMLCDALRGAGVEEARSMMAPFWVEHGFGLAVGETTAGELREEVDGNVHRFFRGETMVAEFEPGDVALTEPLARMYRRFLLYECPMHPALLDKVKGAGHVLKTLKRHHVAIGEIVDTNLTLTSVTPTEADSCTIPEGIVLGWPPEPKPSEVQIIGLKVLTQKHETPRWTREQFQEEVQKKLTEGKSFQAVLTLMEGGLQTGFQELELVTKIMAEHKEAEPRMVALGFAIGNVNEDPPAGLKVLQGIARSDLDRSYVLDIFIADCFMNMNQVKEAEESFLRALRHNPHITGVWHDLSSIHSVKARTSLYRFPHSEGADYYIVRGKKNLAWFCVDVARSIAPDHFLLRQVTTVEQRMLGDHPDFF